MNFIPRYIFCIKLLIVLNNYFNRWLFIVPRRFLLHSRYKHIARNITKKQVKDRLANTLGDFQNFSQLYASHAEIDTIIRDANQTLNHQFEILGSGLISSDPIDWHCDFKSGFRWPKGKYYKKYIRINKNDNSDVKVPIELSRCHHLLWLGEAFLITKDEKYSDEIVNEIRNWITENPYAYSINWSCTMDVAIRAVNWMYALNMIITSKAVDDKFCRQIVKSLLEHLYFIYHNLEKGAPYSGNHYASNLSGLIFLGLFFRQEFFPEKYLNFAQSELFREIRNEVLPTGVHYEKSISYHRLIVELFTYPILVLQKAGIAIPLDIRYRIKSMFDFVQAYTKPDGTAPLIGDNDDGRLLPFVKYAFNKHTYLLNLASLLYKDVSYTSQCTIDTFFLLQKACSSQTSPDTEKVTTKSKIFPDAGFVILRNEKFYVFFNNSGVGMYATELHKRTIGVHNHPDLLSFDLSFEKCNIFTDAGSYVYTSSLKAHNEFRSTQKHSTLNIDGQNQYQVEQNKFWCYSNFKIPSDLEYINTDTFQEVSGEYTWDFPKDSVVHKRSIKMYHDKITLKDEIKTTQKHLFQFCFMLDPGINVESIKDHVIKFTNQELQTNFQLEVTADYPVEIRTVPETISPSYGHLNNTLKLIIEVHQKEDFQLYLNIIPN